VRARRSAVGCALVRYSDEKNLHGFTGWNYEVLSFQLADVSKMGRRKRTANGRE